MEAFFRELANQIEEGVKKAVKEILKETGEEKICEVEHFDIAFC